MFREIALTAHRALAFAAMLSPMPPWVHRVLNRLDRVVQNDTATAD